VAHDVASCEPQEEQTDKEITETAAATAMTTASRLVGFRISGGRRSLGSSLVARWELIRRYSFNVHLEVHLVVGVGREENTLGRVKRSHG